LRVCDATDRLPRAFRVWHSGGHRGRPSTIPARDFAGEGVRLGANWYPLEEYAGQRFRWINNDAQVSLGLFAAAGQGAFVLDAETGPGLEGKPCRLKLLDPQGHELAAAVVQGRQTVRLAMPQPLFPGTVLRFHVEGGGRQLGDDPRILNLRVFG